MKNKKNLAVQKKVHTREVLLQLAKYLQVVHCIELDLDDGTCHAELAYYAVNLHDDVLHDAWKSYEKERLKGAERYKEHFIAIRKRISRNEPTIRPFYAVSKSIKLDSRSRLRREKIYMSWY